MKKIQYKRKNSQILAVILVLGFAVVGTIMLVFSKAATTTGLSLSSSTTNYTVGSTITMDINLTSTEAVASFQSDLTYDSARLTLGTLTATQDPFDACVKSPASGAGKIYLACASSTGTKTGTFKVATVTFTVLATGSTSPVSTSIGIASTSKIKRADLTVPWNGPVAAAITFSLITPDITPPTPSGITMSPSVNPVTGTVTFSATATDNVAVSKMEIYVNNARIGTPSTGGSVSATWDSNSLADNTGTGYPVFARAYDSASPTPNTKDSAIFYVKVQNNKPDLVVTNIVVTPVTPATLIPVKDGLVKLSAVIRNSGTAATPAGVANTIAFTSNGAAIGEIADTASLAPAASRTVELTTQWKATLGAQSIVATADKYDLIAEGSLANTYTLPTFTVYKLGDATKDGIVGLDDLTILASKWNSTGATFFDGNFNADNVVNLDDLTILGSSWGQ